MNWFLKEIPLPLPSMIFDDVSFKCKLRTTWFTGKCSVTVTEKVGLLFNIALVAPHGGISRAKQEKVHFMHCFLRTDNSLVRTFV